MLRAATRSISVVGRDCEMSDLRAWLYSGSPISVRVMTGAAGYGKSRLALELIDEITPSGWHAGFLTRTELKRFLGQPKVADWGWDWPVLAVVDYAAASARDLHSWLMELVASPVWENDDPGRIRPLRVLLLERHAEPRRGWWAEAFGLGSDAAVLERMLDPPAPYVLGPIVRTDQRREILRRTIECLGSSVTPPEADADQDFDWRLRNLTWGGVPLLLMMAAVTAARDGFGHMIAMGTADLAIAIAETELSRILKVVTGNGVPQNLAPLVHQVVAVATLRQGLSQEDAVDVIEREISALRYDVPGGPAVLRDALVEAMPDSVGGVAGVEPDLIGEALLLCVWACRDIDGLHAISRSYTSKRLEVTETVIRACQDFGPYGHRQPLDWLRHLCNQNANDPQELIALSDLIPAHTLELRKIAAELCTEIVEIVRLRAHDSRDSKIKMRLALSLNNLSNRLSDIGRWEDALSAIDEATGMCRTLDNSDSDIFGGSLAMCLNNRALHLSRLGNLEEALAANQEATDIYRGLTVAYPAYHPDLAMSLNNLSNRLADLGSRVEGLAAAEEATRVYRKLSVMIPDPYRAELAGSLSTLSSRLSETKRHKEAFNAMEEATRIYRDLTAARSDAYCAHLAMSINNLSNRLSALKRFGPALDLMQEAVTIARDLAVEMPDVFRRYLAMYLSNLSVRLSDLGRLKNALEAIDEAVIIRRGLAVGRSDLFRSELARSLSLQSNYLFELDRCEDAYNVIEEAVEMLAEPFLNTPRAYVRQMSATTRKYRQLCEKAGRHLDAALLIPIDEVMQHMGSGTEYTNDKEGETDG